MWPGIRALKSPRSSPNSASRRALSLHEVLIVVAVIAFLLAMLVPGLSAARQQAWDVACMNNLHQWGVATFYYRFDHNDYLPTEGTYLGNGLQLSGTWFNELPPYLGLPAYRELEGVNVHIKDFPNLHVWICPAKNVTGVYKSGSGKNVFHYGLNQVLDGIGSEKNPSPDAPDFPDHGADPIRASRFMNEPNAVYMFDILPNSPAGTPRNVATEFQKDWLGIDIGRFHGDRANLLLISGVVQTCNTDDLVTQRDFSRGEIVWYHPNLYWGYRPPPKSDPNPKPKQPGRPKPRP
jgi:competence protein ComGC